MEGDERNDGSEKLMVRLWGCAMSVYCADMILVLVEGSS